MPLTTVQNIIFPNLDVAATEASYVRCYGGSSCNLQDRSITMPKGSRISLDTFYNSFDISFWKKYTKVDNLFIKLYGMGRIRVTFYVANIGPDPLAVDQIDTNLSESNEIPINCFKEIQYGKLYIVVVALSDAVFCQSSFLTASESVENVKLGIAITHYDRKQFVIPAIRRIETELTNQDCYAGKIELVVVDNSQNILPSEVGSSEIIKNENTGGSGGFTRGLLYLKDHGFTHCLFADDDGSFEIDCIKRTYAFYSYLSPEYQDLAITGVLLRADHPNIIIEKGVLISSAPTIQRNKKSLDVNKFDHVLKVDDGFDSINYGAWCYFCFPIKRVKKMPFPFFVRGDDVLFSLQNRFRVVGLCGIACYVEDFDAKESPLSKYLSYRAWYVNRTTYFWNSPWKAIKFFSRWYLCSLFSYQFESAYAILTAHNEMLEGGKVFTSDIYMKETRKKFSDLIVIEKLKEVRNAFIKENNPEGLLRKLFRIVSLQGLLIPGFMFKNKTVYQNLSWRATFRQIFLYKRVLFYSSRDKKGYLTTHNKKVLFLGLLQWVKTVLRTFFWFSRSRQELIKLTDNLSTESFWRGVLHIDNSNDNCPPRTHWSKTGQVSFLYNIPCMGYPVQR